MSNPLAPILAELVLRFSQEKKGPWSPEDIQVVERARAALEQDNAMEQAFHSSSQQEAQGEAGFEGSEDSERGPPPDWQRRPGPPRR